MENIKSDKMSTEEKILNELKEIKNILNELKYTKNELKYTKCRMNSTFFNKKGSGINWEELKTYIIKNPKQIVGYIVIIIILTIIILSSFK